jgi:hypothetical protein
MMITEIKRKKEFYGPQEFDRRVENGNIRVDLAIGVSLRKQTSAICFSKIN